MTKKKRAAALLLTVVVFFAIMLSLTFVFLHVFWAMAAACGIRVQTHRSMTLPV